MDDKSQSIANSILRHVVAVIILYRYKLKWTVTRAEYQKIYKDELYIRQCNFKIM